MMTQETLRKVAPSIFATSPASKMSNKYTFVPTFEIVEKFESEGWKVHSAKQLAKGRFNPHEVRLTNGNVPSVGDSLIQIVIKNSHNGVIPFSIQSGLFRLVCSNGLTVPTSLVDSFSFKHMSIDMGDIRQISDEFVKRLPIIEYSVNKMETKELTEGEAMDFVQKASLIRWNKGSVPSNISLVDLITPERIEDEGRSLWRTFNVVQEKFVRGGVTYNLEKGRRVTTKELKNFQSINRINTELWELAESYCD